MSLGIWIIGLASCGPNIMYENETKVPDLWTYDDPISFSFEVDDTVNAYDIILNVDYDKSYRYQNLYTKLITTFPNQESSEDVVSLDLRKKTGASNGKCFSANCTVPFLIQQNVYFQALGTHTLDIFQHTRQDSLPAIHSIELILQQVEKQE